MMTSTLSAPQQQTDGRTVREIVEHNQELVNEAWCRRIIRQLLQSLELQYAMQMPHRPITPDTVLVLDSGDPLLLPTPATQPGDTEAQDMHDLAAVIHYAITREAPPAMPLRGRVPGDYSASFVNAIDRCLSPNPESEQRPRTIEQLRDLLGIVVLGPAVPGPAPAPSAPPVAPPSWVEEPRAAQHAGAQPARLQRWLMLVAAATVLLGGLGALAALLHQADTRDALTLALPEEKPAEAEADAPPPMATLPPAPAADAAPVAAATAPAAVAPTAVTPPPQAAPAAATAITVSPTAPQAGAKAAAGAGATYKLLIKPWGTIVVDGVDRGASPPLKRLNLPPGAHTIRILNPSFPEHTVTVQSVKGETSVIELDFTEEEAE
ncbi:hypothetical protein [Massilia niastensis]|uniref:hypothetical protein n=1 Tax=Massilia niastensis TaxID=544911 RepID=UPI00037A5700|nr:hypothetical protein [Massilia niastensis]